MVFYIALFLVVVFFLLLLAPFFRVFQSKGSPSDIIEKIRSNTEDQQKKKILVAYCTRHGSTASIAEKIGDTLAKDGLVADVRPIESMTSVSLSNYDAFILGSGVIWSKLMPEFQDFLADNRKVWLTKPVALFVVCLTIQRDTDANRKRVTTYIDDSISHVPEFVPVEKMAFAGRVDMKKLSFFEAFALSLFFLVTPQRGGDHRNMKLVASWAGRIGRTLIPTLKEK